MVSSLGLVLYESESEVQPDNYCTSSFQRLMQLLLLVVLGCPGLCQVKLQRKLQWSNNLVYIVPASPEGSLTCQLLTGTHRLWPFLTFTVTVGLTLGWLNYKLYFCSCQAQPCVTLCSQSVCYCGLVLQQLVVVVQQINSE